MENNFNITSGSVSDRGLSEKRPENEDSFLVLEDRGVYAVADGVGGAQAGDVASQMAMEILGEAFINQSADHDAEDVMRAAIESANSAIYQMSNDLPQLSSMATTIVALHINGNIATIGHVGDSRAYRLDHNKKLRRETDDHSVVEEEVRAGRMTPEQAANHPSKNVISRALGAEYDVDIDLRTIMLEPGTTFLLCSDGITRHIDDYELTSFLGMDAAPAEICTRLKELCYERGAEDNLTAVIVRIAGEAKELSAAAAAGDGEEMTVASARTAFDAPVDIDEDDDEDGFSTTDTIAIDDLDDQSYLMEESDEPFLKEPAKQDLTDYSSSSLKVPAMAAVAAPPAVARPTVRTTQSVAPQASGGASRLLSALLFLVLGGILGAAAYYTFVQPQPEPETIVEAPQITEMKSTNVPLTAFEDTRRLVDKDPAAYINANAASADTADDYFWMGRAFLLTGKYWEAKRAYTEARNRLATADAANAKILATEISMALAIIESPQATETFSKDIATAGSGSPANANVNVNTAAPGQPIR
jgi:PPM family protein phosphatase